MEQGYFTKPSTTTTGECSRDKKISDKIIIITGILWTG